MLSIWYPEQQCDLYVYVFVKYIMFTEHVECIGFNLFLVLFQWLENLSAHCEPPFLFFMLNLYFNPCTSHLCLSAWWSWLLLSLCWLYLSHLSLLCWGGCCCTHDGFVLFEGFFGSRWLYFFCYCIFTQINSICIQKRNMLFASTAYKYLFLKV